MADLLAAQERSRAAASFVPTGATSTLPTVSLMGGVSRNIGSAIPAMEIGSTGAPRSNVPGPSPFVRNIDAAPGAPGGTGASTSIRTFGPA
eukprot:6227921-Heterocapsa_arctica.AAC.1